MGSLTAKAILTAAPGRHSDGEGLVLNVATSGRRTWFFRYQIDGRRRDLGLGSADDVSLKAARDRAAEARLQVRKGIDPLEPVKGDPRRSSSREMTVADLAGIVVPLLQQKTRNAKVQTQVPWYLGRENLGALWDMQVAKVTSSDVISVLGPMNRATPEKGRRLRSYLRRLFDHGRVLLRDRHGVEIMNPVDGRDLAALGLESRRALTRGHHAALAYEDAPAFVASLRSRESMTARCLEWCLLTAVRADAALNARFSQIDLDAAVWTVPLEFLKDKAYRTTGLRIPLSTRCIEIAKRMQAHGDDLLFPSHTGRPMLSAALLSFLQRAPEGWRDPDTGRPITTHGLRAVFRTWASEMSSASHAAVEISMGHAAGGRVERSYRRTDLLDQRRKLMQDWADFLDGR